MAELKRVFGLSALIVYGVGDILGAGIYALTGKVAGVAGHWMWLSFSLALFIAMFTAFSYAELSSRYPKSGGASYYSQKAFNKDWLGFIVGWIVLFATVVSMATLSAAFSQQIAKITGIELPAQLLILLFVAVIALVNFAGIKHSSNANMVATFIETSGLLIVIGVGALWLFGNSAETLPHPTAHASELDLMKVFQGVALAFYAFIGFEDIANVAEESKDPEKNIPTSIIASLLIAGLLYILIGWLAPQIVPPEKLAESSTPLLDIVRTGQPNFPVLIFSFISLFAIFNTTLLNYVTGSRLLYGMHDQGLVPKFFGKLHDKRQTPYFSIVAIFPVVVGLGFIGDLKLLASSTSALLLIVFSIVNISLIVTHRKKENHKGFKVPLFFPYVGLLGSLGAFTFLEKRSLLIAAAIIAIGALLYIYRKKFSKS